MSAIRFTRLLHSGISSWFMQIASTKRVLGLFSYRRYLSAEARFSCIWSVDDSVSSDSMYVISEFAFVPHVRITLRNWDWLRKVNFRTLVKLWINVSKWVCQRSMVCFVVLEILSFGCLVSAPAPRKSLADRCKTIVVLTGRGAWRAVCAKLWVRCYRLAGRATS